MYEHKYYPISFGNKMFVHPLFVNVQRAMIISFLYAFCLFVVIARSDYGRFIICRPSKNQNDKISVK